MCRCRILFPREIGNSTHRLALMQQFFSSSKQVLQHFFPGSRQVLQHFFPRSRQVFLQLTVIIGNSFATQFWRARQILAKEDDFPPGNRAVRGKLVSNQLDPFYLAYLFDASATLKFERVWSHIPDLNWQYVFRHFFILLSARFFARFLCILPAYNVKRDSETQPHRFSMHHHKTE